MRGRYVTMTLALASLFPLASSFAADTKLVRAVSDHFELYTTDNDAAAKAALTHFETVRAYLLKSLHSDDPFPAPVRIVGFKSPAEYGPYIPRGGDLESKAFSETTPEHVTIVMSGLKPELYQYGVREYVMLLMGRAAPKMAYWMKMGFGELYCTLHMNNGGMVMGSEPARSFRSNLSADFNMEVMFALKGGVDRNKGASDFYAATPLTGIGTKGGSSMVDLQSSTSVDYPTLIWQLMHMLMFKKEYSPKFGAFVGAVSSGGDTVAAVQQDLGESLSALKQDLMLYIQLPSHAVVTRPVQLDKPVTPQLGQLSPADSAVVLAELKAAK